MRYCAHCLHDFQSHEHWRPGMDCSRCACPGFVTPWREHLRDIVAWIRARWGRARQ